MPYADNDDVKIHYQIEGDGAPLLLYHGAFQSIESWIDCGLVDTFKDTYEMIMIDARGHGLSDKPHDPASYRMSSLVSDIVAVLDDIGFDRVNFLGFSSGGYVGFGAMRYAPSRFSSLIIGGAQPYDEWVDSWRPQWRKTLVEKGSEAMEFASSLFGSSMSNRLRVIYGLNDVKALSAWMSLDEKLKLDEELPKTTLPCMLYGGDRDNYSWIGAADRIKVIPRGSYVSLMGAGNHFESFYRPDLLKPHVDEFIVQNS